jgi:hypothetical protein
MRTREQMRSTLAEYPAVEEALDDLSGEHGELLVSTLGDFCERYPDSGPLGRAAVRMSGSRAGWFLVTVASARVWMVAPEGQAVEITDVLEPPPGLGRSRP